MPDPDDIAMARRCALDGKRIAANAKQNWESRMDPRPLTWGKSAELARAVEDLAYHVTWMANALKSQEMQR
jgi:hypothetical protein